MAKDLRLPELRILDVEDMIKEEIHNSVTKNRTITASTLDRLGYAPPEYVKHSPEIDEVGRLSSEALAITYENTAKRIEEMGAALISEMRECEKVTLQMTKECERVKNEAEEAVAKCKAAAELYRDQAKEVFSKIQDRLVMADKVRKTCAAIIDELK
jgi:hypothetical protein